MSQVTPGVDLARWQEKSLIYSNLLGHLKIMSLTSARFNQLLKECYQRRDIGGAIDAFNQFQISQCYHPMRVRVFNAYTQEYEKRLIPCGSCYHCMETKINSWVTRMYAHLEDFKHVYFITLTYRSFSPHDIESKSLAPVSQLLLDKLSDAVWVLDYHNYNHHLSYNPCLLIKSHYQNFFKRLRKNTGFNDITYVICGEFGKTYGRPHFHLLLFSNNEITKNDITRAWSISLWKSNNCQWCYRRNQRYNGCAYDFPIGRVDFNDLVSNGTLNTSVRVRVDGTYLNAANCFAYVCKYVCKQDSFNKYRVLLAFNNLFCPEELCNDPELGIVPFHLSASRLERDGLYQLLYLIKSQSYYENLPLVSLNVAGKISFNEKKQIFGQTITFERYPSEVGDFFSRFAPFVEFSRGTPIGSLYAASHVHEFAQGVFNKPLLQDRSFVVPLYFRRKAENYIYGLRKVRKTIRGVSYPKSGLLDLYRRFEKHDCGEIPLVECVPYWKSARSYDELLQDSEHVFYDLYTKSRLLLVGDRCMSFRYSRKDRKYKKVAQVPLGSWIREQCSRLRNDFARYKRLKRDSFQTLTEKESAYLLCARLGQTYKSLNKRFVDRQNVYLHRKQNEYDQLHIDFA